MEGRETGSQDERQASTEKKEKPQLSRALTCNQCGISLRNLLSVFQLIPPPPPLFLLHLTGFFRARCFFLSLQKKTAIIEQKKVDRKSKIERCSVFVYNTEFKHCVYVCLL